MFYITGDTHGDFRRYYDFMAQQKPTEQDTMIVLGDAGLNLCNIKMAGQGNTCQQQQIHTAGCGSAPMKHPQRLLNYHFRSVPADNAKAQDGKKNQEKWNVGLEQPAGQNHIGTADGYHQGAKQLAQPP